MCGYMPSGIRTYVDDREESRARARKQRKDNKKCGMGHHHVGDNYAVHVEIFLLRVMYGNRYATRMTDSGQTRDCSACGTALL